MDTKRPLPLLKFRQLFYLALGAFGIQFASSLQLADTSSLFKFLGADSSSLGYLWLAAPIAGLIIQPIVGQFSDSTMTRYGKRLPYIFGWGLLSFLGLFLLPFANSLWVGVALVWVLSCSLNGCTEALRALTGDMAPNQQKAKAFAWQSVSSGIGAGIAAVLPWVFEKFAILPRAGETSAKIPVTLQVPLFIGAFVLLISIVAVAVKIKERAFIKKHLLHQLKAMRRRSRSQNLSTIVRELLVNLRKMPKVIKDLSLTQLFTWTGMFCLWLYMGLALAQHVFGLPIGADLTADPHQQRLLEKGTMTAGICFGIYQFVSVLYALVIARLTDCFSPRLVHAWSLLVGGVCLTALMLTKEIYVIYGLMVGVGIMWGSLMTMPYAIIAAGVPRSKMGVYLGIFNITVTIPQIFAGLSMGAVTEHVFGRHAIYSVTLGGAFILIGAFVLLYQERAATLAAAGRPTRGNSKTRLGRVGDVKVS